METIMGVCPECGGFIIGDESTDDWYCETCGRNSKEEEV